MFIIKKDGVLSSVDRWSQVESLLTLAAKIYVFDEAGKFLCHNAYGYLLADIPRIYDRWANKQGPGGPGEWVKRESERLNRIPYQEGRF